MSKNREQILNDIKELIDDKYKEFHSGLCPGTDNILGVRVPALRKYAKKLIDTDGAECLNNIGNDYYEEIMLQGMVLGLSKIDPETKLYYLEKFIPKIDNWAVCDITCSGLNFVKKNKELVYEFIQRYLKSDKEFELRFAIVMLLDYYVTDEYVDEVIKIIDGIKNVQYYYVKMAIAWTLSVAYVRYPEKILEYLSEGNNNLEDDIYNKSLQKIIDSNRVNKIEKNRIRRMKRKSTKIEATTILGI